MGLLADHVICQIALGTLILLLGVLALSWRLNNDPSTRPPVSQNPVTPGMGFVDDQSDSETETDTMFSEMDEESELANNKESPIVKYPFTRHTSLPNHPRTPTMKSSDSNDLLSITPLRNKGITESEEIWEELEDDGVGELTPFARRKSSDQSQPSPKATCRDFAPEEAPNESTALLGRSGTGRSYRTKGARRSSHLIESQERNRRKSASLQDAQGGWWKMKRWFKVRDWKTKGKGRGDDNSNGIGIGNGA